jgi:hypothetical protein
MDKRSNQLGAYHKSKQFLADAKRQAVRSGYNPDFLQLGTDGKHKLTYHSPEGIKHFGLLGYGDFLYYKRYEPKIARQKRYTFRTSHKEITKLHHLGKYSPNELAINILW